MTKTVKSAWLPLILTAAAMLALVGWLAAAGTSSAAVSSLGAGSGTAAPGGTVAVELTAEASGTGIGAYEVLVNVGGTAVTGVTCAKSANPAFDLAVCNANYDQNDATVGPVFFTGASTAGATGTVVLGTVTATCGATAGSSTLTVTINKLSDPAAADITVTAGNGTVTCEEPATPTPSPSPTAVVTGTPTASPTATPKVVPATGGEPGSSSLDTTMLVAAALGLVIVAGGAWTIARARRQDL